MPVTGDRVGGGQYKELQCVGDPALLLTADPTAIPVLTAYIGDSARLVAADSPLNASEPGRRMMLVIRQNPPVRNSPFTRFLGCSRSPEESSMRPLPAGVMGNC